MTAPRTPPAPRCAACGHEEWLHDGRRGYCQSWGCSCAGYVAPASPPSASPEPIPVSERDRELKRGKMWGRELSPEEAAAVLRELDGPSASPDATPSIAGGTLMENTVPQDPMPEVGNVPLPAYDVFTCSDCGETFDARSDTIVVEYFRQQPVGVYHDRCLDRKREAAWRKFAFRCASYLNREQIATVAQEAGVLATFCTPHV